MQGTKRHLNQAFSVVQAKEVQQERLYHSEAGNRDCFSLPVPQRLLNLKLEQQCDEPRWSEVLCLDACSVHGLSKMRQICIDTQSELAAQFIHRLGCLIHQDLSQLLVAEQFEAQGMGHLERASDPEDGNHDVIHALQVAER